MKLLFMIYTDFESLSVPEDNGKQNPEEFYKYLNKDQNKYQEQISKIYCL